MVSVIVYESIRAPECFHFGVLFCEKSQIILYGCIRRAMKIRVPEYYKDFACIGGTCIDTCCAGWEVDVDKNQVHIIKVLKALSETNSEACL